MIISHSKKIVVFLNPKTGTETLSTIFKNIDSVDFCDHEHGNYHRLLERNPNTSYYGYKFYSLFRNPVDRFISAYNYQRRSVGYYQQFVYYFCGDRASEVSCADTREYRDLPPETKEMIESVTLDEFLESGFIRDTSVAGADALFAPQVRWVSSPVRIHLLDYDDFTGAVNVLSGEFGARITNIPRVNASVKLPSEPLTQNQIDKIQAIYKDDYAFFQSKNIIF